MTDIIIEAQNLTKVYTMGTEKVYALKGVSLDIFRGTYVSIMGPSGSGKSTFFNIVGGLDQPTSGEVFMDGQLDECDLTLKDLNLIQESFVRVLNGVFHHRVTYYDDINGQTSNGKIKSVYDYPDRKSSEKNHLKPQADSQ